MTYNKLCPACKSPLEIERLDNDYLEICTNKDCDYIDNAEYEEEYTPEATEQEIENATKSEDRPPFDSIIH